MTSINSIIVIAKDTDDLFVNLQGLGFVLDEKLGFDNIMSDLMEKTIKSNGYQKHYFVTSTTHLSVADTLAMLNSIIVTYYWDRDDRYDGINSVIQKIDEITSVLA